MLVDTARPPPTALVDIADPSSTPVVDYAGMLSIAVVELLNQGVNFEKNLGVIILNQGVSLLNQGVRSLNPGVFVLTVFFQIRFLIDQILHNILRKPPYWMQILVNIPHLW